ncbi:MAG TPA: potassium transporter Kup [Solirubrobacteraceae bacterium]|nr:potassium transporter Kup [Solirubrobacteraceae bacterium]
MHTEAPPSSSVSGSGPSPRRRAVARAGISALTVGALGVVFGDIGTSPLYAVQAVFTKTNGRPVQLDSANVYGVISLVFWAITMIVSVKYVIFIMRADNQGEGGIMALTALIQGKLGRSTTTLVLITLGVLGACLFYGDGAITPAISVVSAVAGLKVAVPSLGSLVLPITVAVLCMLFAIQRFGTRLVGNLFGPVMLIWFSALALLGLVELVRHPGILRALSPSYGARFFIDNGGVAFISLASVVLAVTGAEALYADMGHFGRGPIRRAWFFVVFPALTINYLAQGSLILRSHKAAANPFYFLVPGWAQIPMVILATVATVIASQAVISGAFSVSQQAVQLGFLPRLTIRHTSEREVGQVYVPAINALLFVSVVAIVIAFGSATALSNAYGVAVTGTFFLTTVLFLAVCRLLWHKPWKLIAAGAAVFLTIDTAFFSADLTKIVHGGWLPLVLASGVFFVLMTWSKGRAIVAANRDRAEGPLRDFIEQVGERDFPVRDVSGVSVFLNPNLQTTPLALRANVELNHVLHDQVIIVSVETERVPHVPEAERVVAEPGFMFSGATGDPLEGSADRFTRLTLRFGFLDEPDIPTALRLAAEQRLIAGHPDVTHAFYFVTQIAIVPTDAPGMSPWRKKIFVAMARNAANPAEYYRLPADQTVTMGGRVDV